jgi:hypothetical protein
VTGLGVLVTQCKILLGKDLQKSRGSCCESKIFSRENRTCTVVDVHLPVFKAAVGGLFRNSSRSNADSALMYELN